MCSPALVNVQGGRRGRTGLGFPPQLIQFTVMNWHSSVVNVGTGAPTGELEYDAFKVL